jgi:uncharacterized membrane protein
MSNEQMTQVEEKNEVETPVAETPAEETKAEEAPKASTNSDNRILYALSYPIGLVGLILILVKAKEDPDARYHGFNGLGLSIAFFIATTILGFIPILGWIVALFAPFVFLVYSIMLAIKAYNGEKPEIPVLTNLVMEQTKNIKI